MPSKNAGYLHDVDQLVEQTPLDLVLQHYGLPLPDTNSGEYRMNCVFTAACSESKYGQLTVNLSDPAKVIYCHSCEVRGNLLVLIHGLEQHRPPNGGRLRGDEFKGAVKKLRDINGVVTGNPTQPAATRSVLTTPVPPEKPIERNVPLRLSENETARSLATLCNELETDVAAMPPKAAAYFRERAAWLTPNVMRKWGVGYLPRDGRSMFRGWVVYTHRDERGDVLSYSGRDVGFEEKWQAWLRAGKPDGQKPAKHKYVKGYHRGQELYGQQASRLDEPQVIESLQRFGLVVCEGMNDVVRLDTLGVAAVGLCSNKATGEQVEKIVRFAKQAAAGRTLLMPDTDEEGESACKELLWRLNEAGLTVRLGWSRAMHGGRFIDRQPEQLTPAEWEQVAACFSAPSKCSPAFF